MVSCAWNKIISKFVLSLLVFTLAACAPAETTGTASIPTKISLDEDLAEEERAEEFIATKSAEKTQATSRVSSYVKVSNGERTYLAFWFPWNDEHVLLPLNEIHSPGLDLVTCQLNSDTEISSGILISGVKVSKEECVLDEGAQENAPPIVEIPGYFDGGLSTEEVNVIDLNGEYAGNLADIITFVIKNDLVDSGDLTLSLQRTDGPNGSYNGDPDAISYTLPAEALQVIFTDADIADFESAEDPVFALERKFSWEIPQGIAALNLSAGDENWFVLVIREDGREPDKVYLQIKGVGVIK